MTNNDTNDPTTDLTPRFTYSAVRVPGRSGWFIQSNEDGEICSDAFPSKTSCLSFITRFLM